MEDCVFCKIIAGEIPSDKVYEDEICYAFRDIHPQAPTHILIAPKTHAADLIEASASGDEYLGHLLASAVRIAREQGLENGFRVVINTGRDGAQSVAHLHLHLLGGARLSETMN